MAEVARAEQLPNAIPTLLSTLADFHIVARFFLVLSIFIIAVGRQLVLYIFTVFVVLTCAESPEVSILAQQTAADLDRMLAGTTHALSNNEDEICNDDDDAEGSENQPLLQISYSGGPTRMRQYRAWIAKTISQLRNLRLSQQRGTYFEPCATASLRETYRRMYKRRGANPFPAIELYVIWISGVDGATLLANGLINGVGGFICVVGRGLMGKEQVEFAHWPYPLAYRRLFPVITAVSKSIVTASIPIIAVWWIQCILRASRPTVPNAKNVEITTLAAFVLYSVCWQVATTLPIMVFQNVDTDALSSTHSVDKSVAHSAIVQRLIRAGLYYLLELPATVYVIRCITSNMDPKYTIVHTLRRASWTEFTMPRRGITWKRFREQPWMSPMESFNASGWVRLLKMHVKIIFILTLLALMGYTWLLAIFGPLNLFNEIVSWITVRYMYEEGGWWETFNNLTFWARVVSGRI